MNNGSFRKRVVFVIVILFVFTSLSPIYAGFNPRSAPLNSIRPIRDELLSDTYNASKAIYLNRGMNKLEGPFLLSHLSRNHGLRGSLSNSGWDIIVPDDYPTIQEAVDHAESGYRIFVRSGIYYENVVVDVNALEITGKHFITTIVDGGGGGTVFEIAAFMVNISGFTIQNGEIGVTFTGFSPTFNTIYGNTISNNDIGIEVKGAARSNTMYHNNFINNSLNAYDPTENSLWYNPKIKNGNYWDDYNGTDEDGDGIGDAPYDIPGNRTQDLYPLMEPYVPKQLTIKITKPREGFLYIMNQKVMPFVITLIIGKIDIEVNVTGDEQIDRVNFFIDGELKSTDKTMPYSYSWKQLICSRYSIKAVVYDENENHAEDEIYVWKWRIHPVLILGTVLLLLRFGPRIIM